PPIKLVKAGELNEDLLCIVCENVRTPLEVRGDILSYITANESAARRLIATLDEFDLKGLGTVSETIIGRSRRVVHDAVADLPKGSWRHAGVEAANDMPTRRGADKTRDADGIDFNIENSY